MARPFAELLCRTAFSFGEGASSPEEMVDRARELGYSALGLADRDGVYGLPRAHKQAQGQIPMICGARMTVNGSPGLALLVRDNQGWSNLCRLITASRGGRPREGVVVTDDAPLPIDRSDARKGWGSLPLQALLDRNQGLEAVLIGAWRDSDALQVREAFGERASVAISRRLDNQDLRRFYETRDRAVAWGLPLLATADPLMHQPARKRLADVITCIRLGTTLPEAGRLLDPNASRCLQPIDSMERLFRGFEPSLDRSVEIAERCHFSLANLAYRYPREIVPEGVSTIDWLRYLTWEGLAERYPDGVPSHLEAQVDKELELIDRMGFAPYFLTVYDAVAFARQRNILCQGRGSAANSVVCYALGVTSVDPANFHLLFERFISEERGEPPDIDVDFEHERREEVIQYVYSKYGRDRAAMVGTVISWRRRSAIRELGKALGLSLDQVDRLAKLSRWRAPGADNVGAPADPDAPEPEGEEPEDGPERGISAEDVKTAGLDPTDPAVAWTLTLADELEGLPRHMSIHVGGFTISDGPLIDLVPIEPASMEGRTILQWDKDDIDIVGFVKVDLLALGMLTAIQKAFRLIERISAPGVVPLSLASIPDDEPRVYDMLCRSDSLGVFQVESRAQMSMLPRLKPRTYYDLVVEISLVRPGPIQGGMVHPYLKRRSGEEAIVYPHPKLKPILERTLGIPIFQEQVMAMAVAVGGFSPGQADELRRAMGAFRKRGKLAEHTERLKTTMLQNGITSEYADQICQQIQGFGEYGFPESHAASFARLVWVSSWLRAFHPAAFAGALINAQPMGFYSPRSIIADAQRHGVEVTAVDVNYSNWDCTLEPGPPSALPSGPLPDGRGGPALRLGLRLVAGLGEKAGKAVEIARRRGGKFKDVVDLQRRTELPRDVLARLARADALRELGPLPDEAPDEPTPARAAWPASTSGEAAQWDRRQAWWAVAGLYDTPLFRGLKRDEGQAALPRPTEVEELEADYQSVGLSVSRHPIGLLRTRLNKRGVRPALGLPGLNDGDMVRVAGVVTHRQRPGTANGMVFMTLEDETGMINLVVRPDTFERQRTLILTENLLMVRGKLQRKGDALSLLARQFFPLKLSGAKIQTSSRDFR